MATELFKKYYSRLAREGFFKALVCGLLIGFSLLLLSAFVCWFIGFKHFWIAIAIWAVATAAATPIFYYKKFRPSTKAIAKRIDELGLEERLLTMVQLENDTSYLAMRQREDAMAALNSVNAGLIKIAVSVPLVVAMSVVAAFGLGMTTASAMCAAEKIPSGIALLEKTENGVNGKEFEVVYEVNGEGTITGEVKQKVKEGADATAVLAVPQDGWVFLQWSDGSEDAYRQELAVSKDLTLTAIFASIEVDPEEEAAKDTADDLPKDISDDPNSDSNDDSNDIPSPPQSDNGEGGGSGADEKRNQIIDGETYYGGSTFEQAQKDAQNELSENDEIPEKMKDAVEDYFDTIEK